MRARVDTAPADAAAAGPTHPRLPEPRHLLAFRLRLQDPDDSALERFKPVDGHVNALRGGTGARGWQRTTGRSETWWRSR